MLIPFIACGLCLGVYENVINYTTQRRQFKTPLAGFQLQQEKLVRILSTTNSVLLQAFRLAEMADKSKSITDHPR